MTNRIDITKYLDVQPTKNMSDALYQKISGLIMDGILKEGYIFPNEAVLCEQLSVGRSTLREAYKALELTGYVTRSKREGTVVNSREHILANTPIRKSFENASSEDFAEYRLTMEIATAYGAAQNNDEKMICRLKEINEQMKAVDLDESGAMEQLKDLDKMFHFQIAAMSQNKLFKETMIVMSEVWDQAVRNNFFVAVNEKRFVKVFEEHEELITAIGMHNRERARTVMQEHIKYVSLH